MKLGIYNYVVGMTTHANPRGATTTWVVWANTRHVISLYSQLRETLVNDAVVS